MKRALYWALTIAWMGLIFALSAQPQLPEVGEEDSFWNTFAHKGAHIVVFAVLAGLYYRLLGIYLPLAKQELGGLALCAAVLYGLVDELHQMYVPGRTGRLPDVVVDAVGAALAIAGMMRLETHQRLSRRLASAR